MRSTLLAAAAAAVLSLTGTLHAQAVEKRIPGDPVQLDSGKVANRLFNWLKDTSTMLPKLNLRQIALCGSLATTVLLSACAGFGGGFGLASTASRYANVPTPTVTLLPSAGVSADRSYPFLAADYDPKVFGFVEQEFLIEGQADSYDTPKIDRNFTPVSPTAKVVTSGNPYRTRIMVYRPTDPTKFNGTVIVEWVNASNTWDTPIHWFEQKGMIFRKGYAYVWVSNQDMTISGPNGLKAWSPNRYGSLDVSNGGKFKNEELAYDIFSQTAKAVRADPKLMGGMPVKKVIAAGESQSAFRGGVYLNSVHPLTGNIFDAALLTNSGPAMRTDLSIPVIKILTESEFTNPNTNESTVLQPDADTFKTWYVTGATHSNLTSLLPRTVQYIRDRNGAMINDGCGQNSRVPLTYAYNAGIVALEKYLDQGAPIPTSPKMQVTPSVTAPSVARDAEGFALGGLRYPEIEVPVALNSGLYGTGCNPLGGTHTPFAKAKLDSLYPTHADYVAKVTASANKAVAAGFMVPEDAQDAIANANASIYGRKLDCGTLCADQFLFPQKPSILNLRWHVYLYYLPDSAKLLAPIDDAAIRIASAYVNVDANGFTPAGRMYIGQAIALLAQYSNMVQDEVRTGALSQDAATYLSGQASRLVIELQRL